MLEELHGPKWNPRREVLSQGGLGVQGAVLSLSRCWGTAQGSGGPPTPCRQTAMSPPPLGDSGPHVCRDHATQNVHRLTRGRVLSLDSEPTLKVT